MFFQLVNGERCVSTGIPMTPSNIGLEAMLAFKFTFFPPATIDT